MNPLPRQKVYLVLASFVVVVHWMVAAIAKPSFALTIYGDANPCVLLILGMLAAYENFRRSPGILPLFWKLFVGALTILLLSQAYWFYYDWRQLKEVPVPVPGDSLFLLAHVFFLSALALRPHSSASGRALRTRFFDFVLLSLWWLALYCYFSLPWLAERQNSSPYIPTYRVLILILQLLIIASLILLCARLAAPWRGFYLQLLAAFLFIAGGNFLLDVSIDGGFYYAGSFYDTPFLMAIFMFTPIAATGPSLHPREDDKPNRELIHRVWTARFAMLGILSLPAIAFLGLYQKDIPVGVETFRLRLVFGAMFVLGTLVYWKLSLLARELGHMVHLTRDSIENLKSVQQQVTHSEKLIALGRLAAGAAHEISNPLTAILGYTELLADIPSLTPEDRANAQLIQQHVHRAQDAVNSLRNTLRQGPSPAPLLIDKNPTS